MKRNFTLGLIIILIGVLWLLNNLHVFPFSIVDAFFLALAKLWPLFLIGIGLSLLVKKNSIAKLLLWLLLIAAILLYGIFGLDSGNLRYTHPATRMSSETRL